MRKLLDPLWVSLISSLLAQLVLAVRWIYRRIRNDEVNRAFVHDMATNHLPHIYQLLLKLCEKQGIDVEPTPPVRWVDLSGSRKD